MAVIKQPIEWEERTSKKKNVLNSDQYDVSEGYVIKALDAGFKLEYDQKTGGYNQIKGLPDEDRCYSAYRESSNNKYVFDNN
jgi:hypothetical protein